MDQFELFMARIIDLQSELMPYPEWAKAEDFEQRCSQAEIWGICLSCPTIFKEVSDTKKIK